MNTRERNAVRGAGEEEARKKVEIERIRRYRRVFTTLDGRWVLNDILYLLGFWNPNVDAKDFESLSYQNFARHLLRICGLLNSRNVENQALVNAWLNLQCLEVLESGNSVKNDQRPTGGPRKD
jgi:hypothetical protein